MKRKIQSDPSKEGKASVPLKDIIHDVRKQYDKSLEEIEDILQLPTKELTSGKIHDLRIEIKRIRALFHLLKFASSKFSEQNYLKPFKELFQNAGKLRSVQVEFDLINRHFTEDQNTNYLHQLHEYKVKRHNDLDKLIKGGIGKALVKNKKAIDRFIKKLSRQDIVKYFKNQEKYISHLLKKSIFREERLHTVRKKIKRYYLNTKTTKSFTIHHQREMLLELLGEWHDHQVTLYQLIKVIHTGNLQASEAEHLNNVRLKLQEKKNKLFEQIILAYTGGSYEEDFINPPYDLIIHHK